MHGLLDSLTQIARINLRNIWFLLGLQCHLNRFGRSWRFLFDFDIFCPIILVAETCIIQAAYHSVKCLSKISRRSNYIGDIQNVAAIFLRIRQTENTS